MKITPYQMLVALYLSSILFAALSLFSSIAYATYISGIFY